MLLPIKTSDKRIIQQVLAGQRDRFAALVERHQALVHAIAFAHTGNLADADDVVQDAFLKSYESLPSLRDPDRFGPWIATIARRVACSHLRQRQRDARIPSREELVTPKVEEREMETLLRHQLDQLEPEQREILLLRYYAGKSVKEVAAALDIAPDAAAKRLQRAREALGERLVTALGESRESGDRARQRVVRVMGAIAAAEVGWHATASAAAASGLWSLLSVKTVVGLAAVAGLIAVTWTFFVEDKEVSGENQQLTLATSAETRDALQGAGQAGSSPGVGSEPAPIRTAASPSTASGDRSAITGRIYNRDTGEGVAGVEVHASPEPYREDLKAMAVSDASGVYRLEGLEPWEYHLRLNNVTGFATFGLWNARPVAVGSSTTVESVDFALAQGCPIRGKVVDEDGAPLSPGSVRAWTPDGRYEESSSLNADGTFAVGGIPETDRVLVQPVKAGYALAPQGPFELPPDGIDGLVLAMGPEATLAGVLLDSSGAPIEGARVSASPGPGQCSGIGCEPSDAQGRFKVTGLFAATYHVSVMLPGENVFRRLEDVSAIEIAKGQQIEGLELVCEFTFTTPGQFSIAGRVIDAAGTPIGGTYVIAEQPDWSETQTGSDGRFRVEGLREADYQMCIWHEHYATQQLNGISAGAEEMKIVLEARGSIQGRVVDAATGSPLKDFDVYEPTRRAHYGAQSEYLRVSDIEGRFTLGDVEPGERSVLVRAKGYAPTSSQAVLVHAGQSIQDLVIPVARGRVIKGIVYDPTGRPAQEAHVFLDEQPMVGFLIQDAALAVTGWDGRFRLESVPASATEITAWHPRYAAARAPIPTGSGEAEVELQLRPGATLHGVVRAEGEPISGLNVSIGDYSPSLYVSQTNEAGEYTIIGLSSGAVEVVTNPTFGEKASWYGRKQIHSVEVREGVTTELDLDFDAWETEVRGRITVNGKAPGVDPLYIYLKYEDTPGFSDMFYTHTDEEGNFRLDGAQSGPATLEVWGTGLDVREKPTAIVNISSAGATALNFDVSTSEGAAAILTPAR
ncbi:MAG: sigma-70 family RNA polymerase sigma factor [Candidatus Hydrogenedentes bacterium]|nr:sigma-70 family RNA polymerase sigma factor [Candidatus Hydrogenedentota bacterium]